MPAQIEKDIYRTIAYFAYFGYPLTSFEVWKWLLDPSAPHALNKVMHTLRKSTFLDNQIQEQDGFYGLFSDSHGAIGEQVATRHERFLNANEKYKKLRLLLPYLVLIPFIEGIAICNSLVHHHTRAGSDIDLFIIAKPGRIWTTRFLSVLPLLLLRQRPGERSKNPIDISFFITSDHLQMDQFRLEDGDPYMSHWVRSLVPLYERKDVFTRLERANHSSREQFPNAETVKRAPAFRARRGLRFPNLGSPEWLFRFLQQSKFPRDIREVANKDNRVVVNDHVLKFHKNDRREEIREALHTRMKLCDEV